ncbi:hypothetical protein ACQ858_06120 [Variovorax ureilyticus]|uniref:hypothetical protein n=1 Tax=Variovorax ureilyticus TaxID=1836198 RepID=UPI003D66AEB1
MKSALLSIVPSRWGRIIFLLFAAFIISHFIYFLLGNGICTGWGTGLIHGTPAHGAGSLPKFYDFVNYSRLRPLRPWINWSNLLSFCIVLIVIVWMLVAILRIPFGKNKFTPSYTLLMPAALLLLVWLTSLAESYTSCTLRNTHLNIQRIFEQFLIDSHGSEFTSSSIVSEDGTVIDALEVARLSDRHLFELKGHGGEPTCGAYVFIDVNADNFNSGTDKILYPAWITVKEVADQKIWALKNLIQQNDFMRKNSDQLFLNIKEIQNTPSSEIFQLSRKSRRYYSVITCGYWPYGWIHEIE